MSSSAHLERETGTVQIRRESPANLYWVEVGEEKRSHRVALPKGISITLGSSRSCDVVVQDRTVSRRHCELRFHGGVLQVRDLASRNGIFAGGARVERAELGEGSCFTMGRVVVTIRGRKNGEQACVETEPLPGVIGTSNEMLRVASRVRRLSKLNVPVLIRGETGTGKDLVAQSLHELGPRRGHPFVVLNMGTLAADLAAAELFGHDRGAFTGAYHRREGAFLTANGGTLFLDEIAELNASVQVQLLRALEQKEVRPIGSSEVHRVDVRIVAATCAPLETMIQAGEFREDLYHRLAVVTLKVPPLRERRGDVSALARYFLDREADDLGRRQVTPSALACLSAQAWRGNVRQLRNAVLRAALVSDSEWIDASDIEMVLREESMDCARMSAQAAHRLVEQHGGNVAAAARASQVPRSTFRGWLSTARS